MKQENKKPVLTPTLNVSNAIVTPLSDTAVLKAGECIVCQIDADGNEKPGTEIVTSIRMWDRTYSKNSNFKLKKK